MNLPAPNDKGWLREHEESITVGDELERRSICGEAFYDITDIKLAYCAREFRGGPDLLVPCYFVEVEHRDKKLKAPSDAQGPRHVVWFPAYL